jgi:hypothetical protein
MTSSKGADMKAALLATIRAGDRVMLLVPNGIGRNGVEWKARTGRAVMPSAHGGWVVNLGGKFGTPGVVDAENLVKVVKRGAR